MQQQTQQPITMMQGIAVPASSVNPAEFFAKTQRSYANARSRTAWAGPGSTDTVDILATGIVSRLVVNIEGTVTVPATKSGFATARWPYDIVRSCKFSANGVTNLINARGTKLKARELIENGVTSDRGVQQNFNGAARTHGMLALAGESWGGIGPHSTIAAGAYNFSLTIEVPIAYDASTLVGAIFAQTSSTKLQLQLDWANVSDLFVLGAPPYDVFPSFSNVFFSVEEEYFPIPYGVHGDIVVPDLSAFHSFVETREAGLSNARNEKSFTGQAIGRQLLRTIAQVWNSALDATPNVVVSKPLAVTTANFPAIGYVFGMNDAPETYSGDGLARRNERAYNSQIGQFFGLWALDFAEKNAFRDSIDFGTAAEARLMIEIANGVTPNNCAVEYVQETLHYGVTG